MATMSNLAAIAALDDAIALLIVGATLSAPTIRTYDGTAPARVDVALSGNTVLAENLMSATPFAGATDDSGNNRAKAVANAITDDSSANATTATGATFARIFSKGDVAIFQISVAESGAEGTINSDKIQIGTVVSYSSLFLALPE